LPYSQNVDFVGSHDLDGRPAFKLAIQEINDRFYLFTGSLWHSGWSVLDVTDPTDPQLIRWLEGPPNTWTIQIQVAGHRMLTALEHVAPGWGDTTVEDLPQASEGLILWDVSTPTEPSRIGQWQSGSSGTHRNYFDGSDMAYIATARPGFDGHILGCLDLSVPMRPELVGSWWWPGQHTQAGEKLSVHDIRAASSGRPFESGGQLHYSMSLHGAAYPGRDGLLYCPWSRAGLVILDASNPADPQMVGHLPVSPPLGSSIAVHSAVPIEGTSLVVINSEALRENRAEPVNFIGVVDVSEPANPILVSLFPSPLEPAGYPTTFASRGGRFGPHNQHQPQGHPALMPFDGYIYTSYFNAGLQIFDLRDHMTPQVAGYYIPDDPAARFGPLPETLVTQVEDVIVDRRGFVYFSEKNSGITIVRFDRASHEA